METLFTDVHGVQHHGTVPRGLIQPSVWEKQKLLAASAFPSGVAEMVTKTTQPFVSKIYDVADSTRATFFGNKVFLVGDALMPLRPNVGMSTQAAAYDCNMLERVVEGTITPLHWERDVMRWRRAQRRFAIFISAYGLRSKVVAAWEGFRWLLLLLLQRLGVR
jgi:hypothetical protein